MDGAEMSAVKLIFALACLGVSVSLPVDQHKTGFSDVYLQDKTSYYVKEQDLKTLILQQSVANEQQSALIQKQASAIQTLETKFAALQDQERHSLVKRSDDVSNLALQAVVQQQAMAIQTLQAKVTSLEDKESQTDTKVTALDTQARKQVAFTVSFHTPGSPIDIGQNGPVKFDTVISNIGQAYDQHTGVFTAPFSGVYAFFLTVRADNQHGYIVVGIMKSTTVLAQTVAEGPTDDQFDKGSCSATTHLNQGDHVCIERVGGATFVEQGPFTAFSGVLLSADL